MTTTKSPGGASQGSDPDLTIDQLSSAVAALTALVGQLRPVPPVPVDPAAQRSSFGYLLLLGLMGRQTPDGGRFEAPFVPATRRGSTITFQFRNQATRGSHVELRAGARATAVSRAPAASREVVAIEQDRAVTQIDSSRDIDSVLVLDGEGGPVVGVGPRLPASGDDVDIEKRG